MREVISIHVGQAGVQIGNACCEYLRRVFIAHIQAIARFLFKNAFSLLNLTCVLTDQRGALYSRARADCTPIYFYRALCSNLLPSTLAGWSRHGGIAFLVR
jgi:hypothetical protein